MRLKDWVSTPNSSRAGSDRRGLKSPAATAWVPSARMESGADSLRLNTNATAIAANSASSRVRVRVIAYNRFRPTRESDSSW